jgi:hypothetical protein
MIKRLSDHMREEYPVVISLVLSLGIIILTIVGWWMWSAVRPIVGTMLPPIEVP